MTVLSCILYLMFNSLNWSISKNHNTLDHTAWHLAIRNSKPWNRDVIPFSIPSSNLFICELEQSPIDVSADVSVLSPHLW